MKTGQRFDVVIAFLTSARFQTVLTTATIGAAALSFPVQRIAGWAGLYGALGTVLALWVIVLFMKRGEIEWNGLLPISLMVFITLTVVSIFWSQYQLASLTSVAYLLTFTVLGVSVALLRDTIQIVRAFGDVLRFTLVVSIVLEIFSGLLIDTPIWFLAILGNIDTLGPIQGIVGTRNQLGIISIIALISFVTELRTRSVRHGVSVGSITLAAICLALSQSPVALGSAIIIGLGAAALFWLRKVKPEQRRFWQAGIFGSAVIAAIVVWLFRRPIIAVLDATKDLDYRLNLWRQMMDLIAAHPIAGWGWIGEWRGELVPYVSFQGLPGGVPASGGNAYFDVWLQLGITGLAAFLLLVILAFMRSWLLAVSRRSVVFVWPALVLLALITASFAESAILMEFGWLTLVVCIVKASRELSWRAAFSSTPGPPELPHERPLKNGK